MSPADGVLTRVAREPPGGGGDRARCGCRCGLGGALEHRVDLRDVDHVEREGPLAGGVDRVVAVAAGPGPEPVEPPPPRPRQRRPNPHPPGTHTPPLPPAPRVRAEPGPSP